MTAVNYEYRYLDAQGHLVVEQRTVQTSQAEDNGASVRAKAAQALTVNATFLALPSPTNPQIVTQVQRLTRETNALIRLLLQQLDDTSDT